MNLTAFRIKNFRSIIDSEWCDLSLDNLTGFVGQNESGKSSILQALYAYGRWEVQSEDLRTDDTIPEIALSWRVTEPELQSILGDKQLPEGAIDYIRSKDWRINIVAKWDVKEEEFLLDLEEAPLKEIFVKYAKAEEDKALLKKVEEAAKNTAATATENPVIETPAIETPATDESAPADINPAPIEVEKIVPIESVAAEESKILLEKDFCELLYGNQPDFVLFEDGQSLLPNTIDIEDIKKKNTKIEGYRGVMNFIKVAGIDLEKLLLNHNAKVKRYVDSTNQHVTINFQEFWSQTIGKNNRITLEFQLNHYDASVTGKAGKPYLEFWINDGPETLHPKQRSEGVRWFLSFYLQMKANALQENNAGTIFLIDEPGRSLHARAQEDALKVFEDIKNKIKIIYTTHSPYMINHDTLYRVRAVQRSDERDEYSETKIIGAHHLGSATSNTLAPILDNMGIGFHSQNVIQKKNNIILEEISAFYYLKAFSLLLKSGFQPNYLPATGVTKIPMLANMFLGWGIEFIIAVDDDSSGRLIYKELKDTLCLNNDEVAKKKLYKIKAAGIEDLFSKTDFKKFILRNEAAAVGDSTNSAFMKQSGDSKPLRAGVFYNAVKDGTVAADMLNKQTLEAFQKVITDLQIMLTPEVVAAKAVELKLNGKGATSMPK